MGVFPTKILLATDGSEDAALATRAAASIANGGGSELHVVYVAHRLPAYSVFLSHGADDLLREEARREVGRWVREAGSVAQQVHLRVGRPVDEILAVAEGVGAGLLVVGARGHGALHRAVLGSVSEGLAHRARIPLLVVRGEGAWPPDRVVIGDDASEPARDAGRLAAGIGALYGAEVTLVRVREGLPVATRAEIAANERPIDEVLRAAEEGLEDRADELEDVLGGRRPRTKALAGEPATSVLGVAEAGERPALVAVGSGGLSDRISDKVLRSARGAVLIDPRSHRGEAGSAGAGDSASSKAPGSPKLLLATDGSYASLRAAEHAVFLAGVLGAKLYALYVVDEDRAFRTGIHYGEAVGELARDGREALGEVAALAAASGVEHEEVLVEGRPREAIAGVAEAVGADYVVLGSHGETGIGRALLGSVSEGVFHLSKRPVLIVGGEAERPPSLQEHPTSGVSA